MSKLGYKPGPDAAIGNTKEVFGSFVLSGSSVGTVSKSCKYASGTRTGTGQLRVTLSDYYGELLWADFKPVQPNAAVQTIEAVISGSDVNGVRSGSILTTEPYIDVTIGHVSQSASTVALVPADPDTNTTFLFRAVFSSNV